MLVVHDITASSYKEKQCLFPSTSRTIKNQQKGELHPDKSQGNGTGQRKPRQLHRQGQITVVLLGLDLGWGGVCLANRTPSKNIFWTNGTTEPGGYRLKRIGEMDESPNEKAEFRTKD